MISITFDQEFLLESFENDAISSNSALKSIVFPPSLKYIIDGININYMLQYVEFQSEYFELKHTCFHCCCDFMVISFPNAKKLKFNDNSTRLFQKGTKLKVKQGAELIGNEFSKIN